MVVAWLRGSATLLAVLAVDAQHFSRTTRSSPTKPREYRMRSLTMAAC